MAAPTPRKKMKHFAQVIRRLRPGRAGTAFAEVRTADRTAVGRTIERNLVRQLVSATWDTCEKFGLDADNEEHRSWMLYWLAFSVYGSKPGRPKSWMTESYRKLLRDVETLRTMFPNATERELCRELCKGKNAKKRYTDVEPETLRRKLQDAKRLERRKAHIMKRVDLICSNEQN